VAYRDAEMLRLSDNLFEKSGTSNVGDFSAKDSRMEGNTYAKEILRLAINALIYSITRFSVYPRISRYWHHFSPPLFTFVIYCLMSRAVLKKHQVTPGTLLSLLGS